MLYKNKTPLFIGHRGSPWKFAENTPKSFLYTIESGADGVEMDVQITKDQEIIVFHDYFIDWKNKEYQIVNFSYSKLNEIFLKKYNQKIFLLDEVLQTIPNNIFLNIEIKSKSMNNKIFVEKLGFTLNQNNLSESIVISSFNYLVIYQYQKIFKNTPIGLLLDNINQFKIYRVKFYKYFIKPKFIHCNYIHLTPQFIEWAQSNKIPIIAYTVNDFKDLEKCINMGVYGIITDNYNFYNRL